MNFLDFLEEKVVFLLFQIGFLLVFSILLITINIAIPIIFLFAGILMTIILIYLVIEYQRLIRKKDKILKMIDDLEEKYLIAEMLPKSHNLENMAYQYALKVACKAMNDKISNLEAEKEDYQEYIESFVHEIKTPIAALSLVYDNEDNYELKQEIQKINHLTTQILFYARSDITEHDYFLKNICLSDLVHTVLLEYKDYILHQKISLNIHDLETNVISDEKWLNFILSQIIQNAIKYSNKKQRKIEIFSKMDFHETALYIIDNGCGMTHSDLKRVFEKGFTGKDRTKNHATGMGLYLAKKLSDRLGLNLQIFSEEGKYTKVAITFPKTNQISSVK